MKRIISIILCLVIVFSISMQCSIETSAIAGVDDVVVLGVCLDLLALGISIHSVKEFCKSDTFKDFTTSVGQHIDSGISTIKRHGKLFIATSKLAWQNICSWVKSKFSGRQQTTDISYDVTTSTHPQFITLKNGTQVPYHDFMAHPFFIYELPSSGVAGGGIYGWYCDGANPGVNIGSSTLRMWCTGIGKTYRYQLVNGSWSSSVVEHTMNYGLQYKGTTGSYYDLYFSSQILVGQSLSQVLQFRTMEAVNDSGNIVEQAPPNEVPEVEENTTAAVTMTSDPTYYPGAVQAPVEAIEDGEMILIEVPQNLVVDANTNNPSLTTDIDAIGQTVSEMVPSQVNPRVQTNVLIDSATVDQIIADTPSEEIVAEGNDPVADIETANKFRLPRSFLEGFPFSIPYSVYVGIQSFISDPVTPTFVIPFSIPRLGIEENMEIDLTPWNPVARLCRAMLSLVWVAGLAMACSKFIKR